MYKLCHSIIVVYFILTPCHLYVFFLTTTRTTNSFRRNPVCVDSTWYFPLILKCHLSSLFRDRPVFLGVSSRTRSVHRKVWNEILCHRKRVCLGTSFRSFRWEVLRPAPRKRYGKRVGREPVRCELCVTRSGLRVPWGPDMFVWILWWLDSLCLRRKRYQFQSWPYRKTFKTMTVRWDLGRSKWGE